MQALLDVILPVFVVIGFGYFVTWRGWFSQTHVDGLVRFTQQFAIPCLLFRAISQLDLGQDFDLGLLFSFYGGAVAGFVLGLFGARLIFGRDWEDCVAIGFCCLFSNSLLLGLPITEQAYGTAALAGNFAIIALHSPVCYAIGITTMEVVRARGHAGPGLILRVLKAMFSNALIIGITLGLIVNLTGLPVPAPVGTGADLMARAALPAALFSLGGVLVQYRPEGDLRVVLYVCLISLIVHPLITRSLGYMTDLPTAGLRSSVITAAMAPGVNAYIFANMYGRAKRVAASSVLIATGLTILTAWGWLMTLP